MSQLALAVAALGTDQLRLERLRSMCRIKYQDRRLEVQPSGIECELGSVAASGNLNFEGASATSLPGLLWEQVAGALSLLIAPETPGAARPGRSLFQQTLDVSGQLDLAKLAKMLPGTLRIREGTEIISGQVQLAAGSRRADDSGRMAWKAQLETANLMATDRGRQLLWERPLRLTLDARDTPGGLAVDNLQCESDFLKVSAKGTASSLAASVSCNLKQLVDQLGQFVDLGGLVLTGDGWGQFHWSRTAQQQFEADGELQLNNFQVAVPGWRPWAEDSLVIVLGAKGSTNLGADTRLDAATLRIKAGQDQLDARLLQPVINLRGGGSWPLEVNVAGQLDRWPARLATFVATDGWQLAGAYHLTGQVIASSESIAVRQARLTATQLAVHTPQMNLSEPAAELTATGRWDLRQQRCQLETASLGSQSATLDGKDVLLSMPAKGPWEMTGSVKYRADLARLRQWFAEAGKPLAWRVTGVLSGTAQLRQSQDKIQGTTEASIANLSVASASGEQFQEKQVLLTARGSYEQPAGTIRLDEFLLTSNIAGAKAAGQVVLGRGPQEPGSADVSGQWSYDWEKLCALARPYLGPSVRVVGRGDSPAWYRGPLSLAAGQAGGGLKWQSAGAYGFRVGPGEVKMSLTGGAQGRAFGLGVQPRPAPLGAGRASGARSRSS